MANPYEQLQVGIEASDDEINKAYLKKVRQFPPERAPDKFQEIRVAFDKIKTKRDRIKYNIFECEPMSVDQLMVHFFDKRSMQRPQKDTLIQALVSGTGESKNSGLKSNGY